MAAMELRKDDGIYDAQGRWIAPLEGNEPLPPVSPRLCLHGALCKDCAKS